MPNLEITQVHHLGLRVADAPRSEAFYEKLGFRVVERHDGGASGSGVVILRNAHGIEINLIVNADPAHDGTNVLMDGGPKRAGYTHVALRVASVDATVSALSELGIAISDGPVRLGDGVSLFVRDPDRNVIELRQPDSPT